MLSNDPEAVRDTRAEELKQAWSNYLALGPGFELPESTYNHLENIQSQLGFSAYPPHQYLKGWVLIEQARLLPEDTWRFRSALLKKAQRSWEDCIDNPGIPFDELLHFGKYPELSSLEFEYRARLALAYTPLWKSEMVGVQATQDDYENIYTRLADTLMLMFRDLDSLKHYGQEISNVRGVVQELTTLLLLVRSRTKYLLPLKATPSLPRQDMPRHAKSPVVAWDVTVINESRPTQEPKLLQVKSRKEEEDLRYANGITLIYGSVDLDNNWQPRHGSNFLTCNHLLMEYLDIRAKRSPLPERERLDSVTTKLLEKIGYKKMAREIRR